MKTTLIQKLLLTLIFAVWSIGFASAQGDATTQITLNGDSITVEGGGAAVSGTTVTITAAGTYTLSGTLTDGQLIVDTEDSAPVSLILNGVDITNSTSAPIYIDKADSASVTLADGTQNTLTDGSSYVYASAEEDEPSATLFSDTDLTIDGNGALTVTANFGDGIVSKDDLTISGNPLITVNAVDDTIRGKDSLTVNGGSFALTSAGGDGLKSDYTVEINGGRIDILDSYEGIEGGYILINGGDIHLTSSDDGINVAVPDDDTTATETTAQTGGQGGRGGGGGFGNPNSPYYLHITGGTITLNAQGDGLDANGSIEMTGGTVIVNGPTMSGNGALDYDGTFPISGGLLIAVGSAGMPQAPDASSSVNSLMVNFDSALSAGTLIHIRNSAGENVLTFAPVKDFQSLVLSSSALVTGDTYEIYVGGSSDAAESDGLYAESPDTLGTLYETFTVSSAVTQLGEARGMRR